MIKKDNKGRFKKGMSPWNKGKSVRLNPKGEFKKGQIAPMKGKKRLDIRGENHFNWKGGKTTMNHYLRTTPKWKVWREKVFRRDDFTCQNPNCKYCKNEIGVGLHPHHIKPLSLYPEMVFEIDNGITYCSEFHLKSGLHKKIKQR